MGKKTIIAVGTLLVLQVLSSCPAKQQAVTQANLPANWPIPELTLPADAEDCPGFTMDPALANGYKEVTSPEGSTQKSWAVGFKTSMAIAEVEEFIDGRMDEAGYLLFHDSGYKEKNGSGALVKIYSSKDGKTLVRATYLKNPSANIQIPPESWTIVIEESSSAFVGFTKDQLKPIK